MAGAGTLEPNGNVPVSASGSEEGPKTGTDAETSVGINVSHLVTPTRLLRPTPGRENKPVGKTKQDLRQMKKEGRRK